MATLNTDTQKQVAGLRANLAIRRAGNDARFAAMRATLPDIMPPDLRTVLNRVREGIRHDGDVLEDATPGAGLPFQARATRIHK